MRMRRKRNLEDRLACCSGVLLELVPEQLDSSVDCGSAEWLCLRELFGNGNGVELELGCGKGRFVCQMAANHPERNFIAVEKSRNVIVTACEQAERMGLKNVRFIALPVEYLLRYLPPDSVERIYLNFSCPYPKGSFANRRLTHPRMLDRYKVLLRGGGDIVQKTDNRQLFEYSIGTLSQAGFALHDATLDLHANPVEDDVMTEYEQRFTEMGQPIYRLVARMPEKVAESAENNAPTQTTDNGHSGKKRVCFFGSASDAVDGRYLSAAEQLGRELARCGYEVVFGSGTQGLMGAVARGVKEGGGWLIGIAPRFFDRPGILFQQCDEMIYTDSMSRRKDVMVEISDAFITAPGGLGTLDELFEVMTLRQLGQHDKPIILLSTDGFYDGVVQQLDELAQKSFIAPENREMLAVAETPEAAVELLAGFQED